MPEVSARDGSLTVDPQNLQYYLDNGDFHKALTCPRARTLFGGVPDGPAHNLCIQNDPQGWDQIISERIEHSLENVSPQEASISKRDTLLIGLAALGAFLQSNVTGPPLDWRSADVIFPRVQQEHPEDLRMIRRSLVASLTVDGEAIYELTPSVELFCLAKIILNHSSIGQDNNLARWERLHVNFWHQRMLNEIAPSLQKKIYDDLEYLDTVILFDNNASYDDREKTCFLLERAIVNIYHGFDSKAREDLERAAKLTGFEYVLTGRLGKRTRFQQKELSQLVVLAKSADGPVMKKTSGNNGITIGHTNGNTTQELKPQSFNLNDDTLLETISFSKPTADSQIHVDEQVPASLAALDPANQPVLAPLDSIILLSHASSITNTSPQHGLTREETLPYATRVLEGGSSNWQIYTQALLVRSRIEGHRSRTVERGVLQLQALVDQVVVETSSATNIDEPAEVAIEPISATPSTFLPRLKPSEAAPVTERLQYIHQLAPPTRWTLEAELAARWVSLGGLRTALEIYERLHMWAEAALCWAAVEREDKARRIVRRQLYQSGSDQSTSTDDETEEYLGKERSPLPVDAPRLFCILGDIDKSPAMYERAWAVSKNRFARAQRSLGKYYLASRDLLDADKAYSKSLKINPQNQGTWFELGCVRLELRDWKGAVDAFTRTIQIDDTDAEAWSNLAAALLRLPFEEVVTTPSHGDSAEMKEETKADPQMHAKEALVAFKRAAALKRESYRIWQNLLNVAAILSPPPYADIIIAQERLIELRGSVEGEGCVDIAVMEGLLSHIVASAPAKTSEEARDETKISIDEQRRKMFGLEHMTTDLIQKQITPLITHSRRLWQLVARFSLHLNRPSSALDAYEKAWRVTVNKPGWDSGTSNTGTSEAGVPPEEAWSSVVDATVELADAYESLGEREKTEGLAAGSGELVCKGWKFKSRSAIRTVMGKARERWENSEGWKILENHMASLKAI